MRDWAAFDLLSDRITEVERMVINMNNELQTLIVHEGDFRRFYRFQKEAQVKLDDLLKSKAKLVIELQRGVRMFEEWHDGKQRRENEEARQKGAFYRLEERVEELERQQKPETGE